LLWLRLMHNFFVFSQQTEKSLLRVTLKKLSLKREIVPLYTTLPPKYGTQKFYWLLWRTWKWRFCLTSLLSEGL